MLQSKKEIFPFESGKTYYLPTPYNSYGAAAILAEAMAAYQRGKQLNMTEKASKSKAGGLKRLPLLLFGLGIVLVVDLQGFPLYNIEQQGMAHFCPVVASLLDGRDFCIVHPSSLSE